jgi:hypothetical protein
MNFVPIDNPIFFHFKKGKSLHFSDQLVKEKEKPNELNLDANSTDVYETVDGSNLNEIESESKENLDYLTKLEKFRLMILPCQAGKTFHSIHSIEKQIEMDSLEGKSLHIVFTMNTLLNNSQFSSRINSCLPNLKIAIMNSKQFPKKKRNMFEKKNNMHFKNDILFMNYVRENKNRQDHLPQLLVVCSHANRFRQTQKIIEKCEEEKKLIYQRIFLYFDEIHQYINIKGLRKMITACNFKTLIHGILGITATPVHIWKSCSKMNDQSDNSSRNLNEEMNENESQELESKCSEFENECWTNLKIQETPYIVSENYAGCDDMEFIYQESFGKSPYQMERLREFIIEKYKSEIFKKGNRVFFPAPYQIIKHQEIKDIIFENDSEAIVVVINSMNRSIYHERMKKIVVPFHREINQALLEIIYENRWLNRAIYFTGNQCVGMGQTLTNEEIGVFSHAIFYHDYTSEARIYQLFGRICGNIKNWDSYKKTKVYCTEYFANQCKMMEKRVFSVGEKYQGHTIQEEQYIESDKLFSESKGKISKNYRVFQTQADAIEFGKDTLKYKFKSRKEENQLKNKSYLENGNLPSLEFIIKNFGLKRDSNKPRMIMTNEYKWCVIYK